MSLIIDHPSVYVPLHHQVFFHKISNYYNIHKQIHEMYLFLIS